jgi:hypothetical protein
MGFLKDLGRNLGGGYIAPDAFATDYDQRSGERKKQKQVEATGRQKERNMEASDVLSGRSTDSVLSGTEAEQEGQLAGLNLGTMAYGQGLKQTGQDIQGVKKRLQERSAQSGADPVSAAIMGQKASSMALAQRSNLAGGMKGAAAAASAEAIGRQKDDEIRRSLYGQQQQSIADERSLLGNMISGQTSLMQGEKAANVQLPSAPSGGGGTIYICTMLRAKNLMTKKESLIMTKFMIKSLITGADFSLWYFKHGKKAVERAEEAGFNWAEVKKDFVDDIIELLKQEKFKEAQSLYARRAGDLCTSFGAEGFKDSFTVPRISGIFKIYKVLTIEPCKKWLVSNFFNIPRILRSKYV